MAFLLVLSLASMVCNAQTGSSAASDADATQRSGQPTDPTTAAAPAEEASRATQAPTATVLFPPDSPEPAAGICERWPEVVVPVPIVDLAIEGAPTPRCIQVVGEQAAEFVNQTDTVVTIQLGSFEFVLQPGQALRQQATLGMFLAPGAHNPRLLAENGSPLGSPTLWLVEG